MLKIVLPEAELWDEEKEEFVYLPETTLRLEHSLVSLSKWEQLFEKPFLSEKPKTDEEAIAYIRLMSLDPEIDPAVFTRLTQEHFQQIDAYLNAKQTATWFTEMHNSARSREVITNELIYYWMSVASLPKDHELWHLNRLFTLIRIVSAKNEKPKKMSGAEAAAQRRRLNEQRRAELGTKG